MGTRSASPMARQLSLPDRMEQEQPMGTGGIASRSLVVTEPNGALSRPQHGTGGTASRSLVSANQGVHTSSPNPERRMVSSPSPRPSTLALAKPKRSRTSSPCPQRSGTWNPDTDGPRRTDEVFGTFVPDGDYNPLDHLEEEGQASEPTGEVPMSV